MTAPLNVDDLAAAVVARLRSLSRPARARGVAAETPTEQECLGLTVDDVRSVVREFTPRMRALAPSDAVRAALAIIRRNTLPHVTVREALSWALRTLVRVDPDAVARFLTTHADDLHSMVVRGTRRKLDTGRKNG